MRRGEKGHPKSRVLWYITNVLTSVREFLSGNAMTNSIRRKEITVQQCDNSEADEIFQEHYWMKRIRRSRKLSYCAFYLGEKVAWIQCADPFGTSLAKPLQAFDIGEAIELCRGYFRDEAPGNIESCTIANVMRRLPNDWYVKFGVVKKIAIVYQDLDIGQKGIVYGAVGFLPYAKAKRARHHSEAKRGNSKGYKIVWARALRPISGQHYKISMPESPFLKNGKADSIIGS